MYRRLKRRDITQTTKAVPAATARAAIERIGTSGGLRPYR